jgi:DNA-binding CsgD family transcriptional regulator/GAF domain-containing protein
MSDLNQLFHNLATARNDRELLSRLMDKTGKCLQVPRWGIYLYDRNDILSVVEVCGMNNVDTFVDRYQQVGKAVDRVLHYVAQYHAPAHERMVFPAGGWQKSELYRNCCASYYHEHILTGPIVSQGKLIGAIYTARLKNSPEFDRRDISIMGGICTTFSACLATFDLKTRFSTNYSSASLTPRELQIAELVARGLTNNAIGKELWITENSVKQALKRIFRKLEITSRTQLIAAIHHFQD